ncbi:MAG TPA: ATP-binding protein, partial [Pyrinomonadaceae bacterium]|nr:ATP-binding protein [Pyrinomonadaceae bacterium]
MSFEERLPPNYAKLDIALRSIGYSLEVAVADIIDNSVDAEAQNILVRFISKQGKSLDLAICDDGRGMTSSTLKEAMRFGADVSEELHRLGKFGLGLKLASLSQAKELHVFTSKEGVLSGRAWLEEGIKTGFVNRVFDNHESSAALKEIGLDRNLSTRGTVVFWSHLYRIGSHQNGEQQAQKLLPRLRNYLSLAFHRFLSDKAKPRIQITMDIFDADTKRAGIPVKLDALDPFRYERTGREGFPAKLSIHGEYEKEIQINAHIWPPNSHKVEYKLPGGANSRQGFYFYRNNRLIQGGGWNGLRESEPHLSLARLEIDITSSVDVQVNLDVKKAEIQLPPSFM